MTALTYATALLTTLLGLSSALCWIVPLVDVQITGWKLRWLDQMEPLESQEYPAVTIIVPALNEADTVEKAMQSLLTLDYPRFSILAVDDRSTDETGAILDRIASEKDHLQVVHVKSLPEGWLGKNHALHMGADSSKGDYLLFTDADVHMSSSTLLRSIGVMERENLDHLVILPDVDVRGFWETLSVWFFGVILTMGYKPWRVPDPKSKAYMGVGAFNLVRRTAYEKSGGHSVLPMDVADDMKLGKILKRSGARCNVMMAGGCVSVRWVVGLRGIVVGLTKNMFGGMDYNPVKAIAGILGIFLLAVWPAIGLFVGPTAGRIFCMIAIFNMVYAAFRAAPKRGANPLYGLGFPIAGLIVIYIILRSMWFTYRQGGIIWRGTLYPLDELRKGVV